jgi:hypothetical protein
VRFEPVLLSVATAAFGSPRSRAGLFLPGVIPKMGSEQFRQVNHFGPRREFERPMHSLKVWFQTPGERRMRRGAGSKGGKRVCGHLKKDLRKRRKFAAQSRFLHQTFTSNSTIRRAPQIPVRPRHGPGTTQNSGGEKGESVDDKGRNERPGGQVSGIAPLRADRSPRDSTDSGFAGFGDYAARRR